MFGIRYSFILPQESRLGRLDPALGRIADGSVKHSRIGRNRSRVDFCGHVFVVISFVVCCKALSVYLPDIVFEHPRCRGCGYDLTGNQSGVCPECGLKLDSLMLEGLQPDPK